MGKGGGQLADLEHFIAYTKDTDTVYLKKHSYLIYKAEGDSIKPLLITNRCDLIKTLKIDGVEQDLEAMGKERTPHVFTATTENDKFDEIYNIITGDESYKYTFVIIEPEVGKEYKVEIEWFDNITECIACFGMCERLISIPSDLFSNCTNATNFYGTFIGCTNLTIIPSDLFSSCTAVTNFTSTFYECSGLTSIPSDLFSNCTQVTDFASTFYECSSLTIMPKDSDGTPIYNRSGEGKKDYAIATGYMCFCNCYNIEGYDPIPNDWACKEA